MLILVRKIHEAIRIDGGIYIQVLSVERDRVKLGISAPDNVKVMRQELLDADPPVTLVGGQMPPSSNGHHE